MRHYAYWSATAVTVFMLLSGGLAYVLGAEFAVGGVVALGYPAYVVTILGVWKLLAVPALLVPGFDRLKEWAYAGVMFDLTGAAASHLAVGDPLWHQYLIGSLLALAFVSYVLRPAVRRYLRPAEVGAAIDKSLFYVKTHFRHEGRRVSRADRAG